MTPFEAYLTQLRLIRGTGQAVPETSYYPAISQLLNTIGARLRPKVHCVINLRNRGAGIPDGGMFTVNQSKRVVADDLLLQGELPERGAIEIKSTSDDAVTVADSEQVKKYLAKYGLVLVSSLRSFALVARASGSEGEPRILEQFHIGNDEASFWRITANAESAEELYGARFVEYLMRVLQYKAPLQSPQDLAWFLASYARDARDRIERAQLPALQAVRASLEESLGLSFEGEKGDHFFKSTLIQTLFYGLFSAWVLWHRKHRFGGPAVEAFNWRMAAWELHVPMIRALFEQVSQPSRLEPLHLVEVLDWAASALNRVERDEFFRRFEEEHAVQYFYEPFLEEFDPVLRKQLGVWYTPPEIVRYMVSRVDSVLKEELGLSDGLADRSVVVLDPCCGTGAYLVETLRHIARTLEQRGEGSLTASEVKRAAIERIFGFEILPAPFVISHLQLGLLLQSMGAPFSDDREERAGVYLTNALTGWEPPKPPKSQIVMTELEDEREAASHVKRDTRVLVVIGNPPYNGFAGVAMSEERTLTDAYRTTVNAPAPQGQGLNDLYVRFYRMAERRIVEMTGKGVVCFISNYSWLDGLSFTGMRERYLSVFDKVWVDCLNGDKYKTGKLTPDGDPDPSVFSTPFNREGIQVGTAIALLIKSGDLVDEKDTIQFRHLWGSHKRDELEAEASGKVGEPYRVVTPEIALGLPFAPSQTAAGYLDWPLLTDLFPKSYPGIQSSRDSVVMDIDRSRLVRRMECYFNPQISNSDMSAIAPASMQDTGRFDATRSRATLIDRGILDSNFVRCVYRPFDVRWLYWEPDTKLIDEKRADYVCQLSEGRLWLALSQSTRHAFDSPLCVSGYATRHVIERGANLFPAHTTEPHDTGLFALEEHQDGATVRPNLSPHGVAYLEVLGKSSDVCALQLHTLAILHSSRFITENSSPLRRDWPRIPLPRTGELLTASADYGRMVSALLDTEHSVSGVTVGSVNPTLQTIAQVTCIDGKQIDPNSDDLEVAARWGYAGQGGVTMPGPGRTIVRDFTALELESLCEHVSELGDQAVDVYLNDHVYWRNVPIRVWQYTIGGYQVMKKWLSYREKALLDRPLTIDEVREVTNIARRIASILLMHPALDANYEAVKADAFDWGSILTSG